MEGHLASALPESIENHSDPHIGTEESPSGGLVRNGCRAGTSSYGEGPPWSFSFTTSFPHSVDLERSFADRVEDLTAQGWERRLSPEDNADFPRWVIAKDDYAVSVMLPGINHGDMPVIRVMVTSPCVELSDE